MTTGKPPVVSFDLDGTLAMIDDYGVVVDAALDTVGPLEPGTRRAAREAYEERFFEAFEAMAPEPYRTGMAAAAGVLPGDPSPDDLAATLLDAEVAAVTPAPGTPTVLDTLADRGYRLALLTNGLGRVQRRKLAALGIDDRFEAVVVSAAVGAHKPDTAIFDALRERLDAPRYVHVGDDADHDVRGAVDAGFGAVHVGGDDPTADATAPTLRAVPETLRRLG
ncbi:HAD family hydrolase [Halobacteriales archaeon SW_7_68_16]|nr:MAG: HAD family hydrolase [Halobacteriales archaeon SW_7_68_16]